MFDRDTIETKVRNTSGLFEKLSRFTNGYPVEHDSEFGRKLLGKEHLDGLKLLAEAYGLVWENIRYTYTILCYIKAGKKEVKVYQPRLVLKKGTAMLEWGDTVTPLKQLAENESLYITPQVVKGDKVTKYALVIGSEYGDIPFSFYPKEDSEPNTAVLAKMVKSGEGWASVLKPPYPVDVKSTVSEHNQEFTFVAIGYEEVTKKGTRKDGGTFTIDELVFETPDGDLYSTKRNNSRNSKDMQYWGGQCSPEEPVSFTIQYEGLGDYQGKSYTQWGVVCRPLNNSEEVSLSDLLDIGDPMEEASDYGLDNIAF